MGFIDNAKQWFRTRLKPTQSQFWQTFDWLRWKDELLKIEEVDQLTTILQQKADIGSTGVNRPIAVVLNGNGSFQFPAGLMIDLIMITPTGGAITPAIGLTDGGSEIYSTSDPIAANTDYLLTVGYAARVITTIYFSGITYPTVFLIYTRTLSYQ